MNNSTGFSRQGAGGLRMQKLGDSKEFGGDLGFGSSTFSFNSNPASLKGKI